MIRAATVSGSLAVLVIAFLCGCSAYATSGRVSVNDNNTRIDLAFSSHDRALITAYFRHNLPPGLAKKQHLPPGLQKQLYRKGHLPPGLQGSPLPPALEGKLSPLPDGYVRLRIGTDVVLMNARTRLILDVITDI